MAVRNRGIRDMEIRIFSGRAHPILAASIARELDLEPGRCMVEDFPDGEIQVELLEDVHGADVYLVQPTGPPPAKHLFELLLIADACRRGGAARITAVVPYFGYARQDRRVSGSEPVGARVAADALCLRMDRLVTVDLHNSAIEGFFGIRVEQLTAAPLLTEALRPLISRESVLVAPDLGAVKLAQRYSDLLDLPVAYVHKIRLSGERVSVGRIVGEVKGFSPVIVDDIVSTGGTVISAMEALLEKGSNPEVTIAATHGLLAGDAVLNLASFPVRNMVFSDTLPQDKTTELPLRVVSVAGMLADAIIRLSGGFRSREA
jgi:ribose-phosphate pyrophosphokinase